MDPSQIASVISAIQSRAWWPAIAGLLTLILWGLRQISPATWDRLPKRLQWLPAVLIAAVAAVVDAYGRGLSWGVSLACAAYAVASVALPAIGLYHAGKRILGVPATPQPEAVEPTPPTLRAI